MGNLGGIEKVMVFGILVIILAILGIAVFSASNIDDDYQAKSEKKSPLNSYFMNQTGSSPDGNKVPLRHSVGGNTQNPDDQVGPGGEGTVEVEEPYDKEGTQEPVYGPGGIYEIKEGDTIIGIARRVYGEERMSQAILAANPGIDARNLQVGATINLPEKPGADQSKIASADDAPEDKIEVADGFYRVKEKDTLYSIAKKFYNDKLLWTKIYDANRDIIQNPNFLTVGMELRIP